MRKFRARILETKKDVIPEIRIIIIIKIKIFLSGAPISSITDAALPVRVLERRNRARKEKDMARVLIIPSIDRKSVV